jgi:Uma2 family endonuclease
MVATRRVTIDEFAEMPLQGIWELVDAEPTEATPASGRSSRIGGRLYARLADHAEPSGLGWVFPAETGFILFDDRQTVRSPDAAVVLRDKLLEPPDSFVPLAPDLAVEVLSPSDRMVDAMSKITMYLQAGVRLVWLIDPETRTVTVFRQDTAPKSIGEGDTLDGGDVLPGFTVPVSEIFA